MLSGFINNFFEDSLDDLEEEGLTTEEIYDAAEMYLENGGWE